MHALTSLHCIFPWLVQSNIRAVNLYIWNEPFIIQLFCVYFQQQLFPYSKTGSPILVTEARRIRENVRKQANYLSHRRIDLDDFSLRVEKQLSDLKSRIKMARNAAESIKISITNQRQGHPDSNPMGCSRSYRVNLTSSTTNEIRCRHLFKLLLF